jgi:aconitate hydratase
MERLDTIQDYAIAPGRSGRMHALASVERAGFGAVSRLPICLRIILEAIIRNYDGDKITMDHIRLLAGWRPNAERVAEIPMVVARILLQDFTGVPLLCDLAGMREAARRLDRDPRIVEPRVPMDLVVDHSVQIDRYNSAQALEQNMSIEFGRNAERYRFIKWGMQAFHSFSAVPPGIGIVHQVNLEYLSKPLWLRDGVHFPDSLVGTDSHTTMINGLGVLGWGVGGIEAEAAMLGQPLFFLMPDVIGVHLHGQLVAGTTATDLVLHITEILRAADVVSKFVEFFGSGASTLSVPDRATIANMAPEYGATVGYFPIDQHTTAYLAATGRDAEEIQALRAYMTAQGMFGIPAPGTVDYTAIIDIDLASVVTSIAGPRRPQDRVPLSEAKRRFADLFQQPVAKDGYGKDPGLLSQRHRIEAAPGRPTVTAAAPGPHTGGALAGGLDSGPPQDPGVQRQVVEMADAPARAAAARSGAALPLSAASDIGHAESDIGHGDVLIAAITSCTNTSNPSVMIAAGLLARHAVERGLRVAGRVKTSLAPGSRVVTAYLQSSGLLPHLERLGFWVTAYGCTTCIGNSGPLDAAVDAAIARHDLVCAAVLSGNRNFEARIHPSLRANFLMSPPLVVAFALAGRIGIDFQSEPLGTGTDGRPVYLRDIWPSPAEIAALLPTALVPDVYKERYKDVAHGNLMWNAIVAPLGALYAWDRSTYIAKPPYFDDFSLQPAPVEMIHGARALAILGDSVTTDHISPAGSIPASSPAGLYLQQHGVQPADFNSYGSRRGHHEVMVRGTFANVRIRNLMLPQHTDGARSEGGETLYQPSGERMPIYDAAMRYIREGTPTLVIAGKEYGTGSSRDWAAKGPRLLGVKAVLARSFERIHRSNLIGMGVLPLQFQDPDHAGSLRLVGDELFSLSGMEGGIRPRQDIGLVVKRGNGSEQRVQLRVRIDTPVEADYYRHGGILPYALRGLLMAGNGVRHGQDGA